LAQILGGNIIPSAAEPISMAYAGHHFGIFVPQLGDGRAILMGEVFDRSGVRRDIQLKAAGRTPFSRRVDARARLGPVRPDYLALLQVVARRQAALVARWMQVGFVHGVMNTDNMAVSGETIDFGPCAFIKAYDPGAVFSSIDELGRYAFGNQARVAQWNIARLAEALLPLIDPDRKRAIELAQPVITEFPTWYEHEWIAGMRSKLGLELAQDGDLELIRGLLDAMQANQ